MTLTPAVKRVLVAVMKHRLEHDVSPTAREIADEVGLSSTNTVHKHILRLQEMGLVSGRTLSPRSIVPRQDLCFSKRGELYQIVKVYETLTD